MSETETITAVSFGKWLPDDSGLTRADARLPKLRSQVIQAEVAASESEHIVSLIRDGRTVEVLRLSLDGAAHLGKLLIGQGPTIVRMVGQAPLWSVRVVPAPRVRSIGRPRRGSVSGSRV